MGLENILKEILLINVESEINDLEAMRKGIEAESIEIIDTLHNIIKDTDVDERTKIIAKAALLAYIPMGEAARTLNEINYKVVIETSTRIEEILTKLNKELVEKGYEPFSSDSKLDYNGYDEDDDDDEEWDE